MVIQSLIAKVAIATLVTGIVGSSIAVPVVLTSGDKGLQVETEQGDPDFSECFVIPTTGGDNQAKLLMCEIKGSETTGRGDQNYWYREGSDTGAKNTKVTKISKKRDGLEITLEGDNSLSPVTLKVTGEGWTGIEDNTDLKSTCELTKELEESEAKWQCFASDGSNITLTKFSKG